MESIEKTSEIRIEVGLNPENVPSRIRWQAQDNPETQTPMECKAFLLSIFDKESRETLKIDLWTQDMQIVEMDRFIFHTLQALGDTYFKATQNRELAERMQQFAQHFGEETEIIPKS